MTAFAFRLFSSCTFERLFFLACYLFFFQGRLHAAQRAYSALSTHRLGILMFWGFEIRVLREASHASFEFEFVLVSVILDFREKSCGFYSGLAGGVSAEKGFPMGTYEKMGRWEG